MIAGCVARPARWLPVAWSQPGPLIRGLIDCDRFYDEAMVEHHIGRISA